MTRRDVAYCEGFRMPACDGHRGDLRGLGPAFENLQRRRSREGVRGRYGVRYRELSAARNFDFEAG